MRRSIRIALSLAMLALIAIPPVAEAGPPDSQTVTYGKALGNRPATVRPDCPDDPIVPPGPPACFDPDHDGSANAADDIVPRTAVISAGGSVTFIRADGNHQAAVYAPGTDVTALKAAVGTGGGFFNIDTATFDRVALGPQGAAGWPAGQAGAFTTPAGTFAAPGRYLMVCTFRPHFRDNNMYGYINVQ